MKITWGLENAVLVERTATTLGSYDGVHLGHRKIIDHLTAIKKEKNCSRSLLVTFHPHPQEVLRKNNTTIQLLTTIDERLNLLEKTGIDETLIIEFNEAFSKTPYETFFRETLIERLGTSAMVVGFNHAFGKNREGDIEHLRTLAATENIFVDEVAPLVIDDVSVSSTKIRHAIMEGDMIQANHFLGRPYSLRGKVDSGDGLGKAFGYPTANLQIASNKLIPQEGVYIAKTEIEGIQKPVALSIGKRPTIMENGTTVVEAFILDFSGDLYGRDLNIDILEFIRPQAKFSSTEELTAAIANDVERVKAALIS
jgi:riboflavin kinase / FMN adenylyltransferase